MGMLSCSAHRHYWEPRLPFVSPSWPPLPSLPPRPKLTPTLSSSLDTGLPTLPPSSTTSSPSARSLSRPSLSARDAMLSLTAPPSPLLLAGTSPDTRSPHALTSSMLSPMATMARGRLRPTPSSSAAPYVAHAKVTTKHCVPGAPIVEDITHDVTKCVPKSVCVDVEAQVPKTVCGDAAAEAEAVEEA